MTNVVPLKKGDRLVPQLGSTWAISWAEAEVLDVQFVNGIEQAWVKLSRGGGSTSWTLNSISVNALRKGWERKPSFYQIGKTYEWSSSYATEKFKILDIYLMDNPVIPSEKHVAFAFATDAYGKQYGTSLSASDFKRMKLA